MADGKLCEQEILLSWLMKWVRVRLCLGLTGKSFFDRQHTLFVFVRSWEDSSNSILRQSYCYAFGIGEARS